MTIKYTHNCCINFAFNVSFSYIPVDAFMCMMHHVEYEKLKLNLSEDWYRIIKYFIHIASSYFILMPFLKFTCLHFRSVKLYLFHHKMFKNETYQLRSFPFCLDIISFVSELQDKKIEFNIFERLFWIRWTFIPKAKQISNIIFIFLKIILLTLNI